MRRGVQHGKIIRYMHETGIRLSHRPVISIVDHCTTPGGHHHGRSSVMSIALIATILASASGVVSAVQGLLPGRRSYGRRARAALQVCVALLHVLTLGVVLRAHAARGAQVYIASAAAFLGVFVLLDAIREASFHLRAAQCDAALSTVPATILVVLLALLQLLLCATMVGLGRPQTAVSFCGHIRYAVRDVATLFGGAVYVVWACYEHGAACVCGPWCGACGIVADVRNDEERHLWTRHRVAAGVGAEAAAEVVQSVMVLCTAVFSASIAEILFSRRVSCSGVWTSAKLAMPMLAAASATLAGRCLSARLRDYVLERSN